ncbi:MAG: peptidylprolyl isomerase [Fibromonadaceae bacterium]|jgi:peptidyl-prolyl cis-trans isomerase D|nr:peptidylprolyl isomerase [Fibromonadaceae bacterium]
MLAWINENAKWVIYISIAGIVAGLLFMDMSGLQVDRVHPVGTVNGEKLSNDLFEIRIRQIQAQQSGLSDEQNAQMREELFRSFVRQHLLQKAVSNAKLTASVYEMAKDLRTNPPQGIDREPMFQTDGVFDFAKYEAWLNDPDTYNLPSMLEYENMLRTARIPENQLRAFINAGMQPSSLEAKFNVLNRETKFDLWNAQGNARAFEEITVSEAAIDSAFKAQPDSFFVAEDWAKVRYVAIPADPSERDEEYALEYANILLAQIKDGADFAAIANNSSEDPGSAVQGGELGDFSPRGKWVPAFDSTAFALDSGEISEPVRTQFGYHIIQSLGKKIEDEVEQVKVRHILISVKISHETTDSLLQILNEVKSSIDAGKSFEDAAKAGNLTPVLSGWFKRGGEIAELGFLPGLSSYAFPNTLRSREISKTSDILQNTKWVVLLERAENLAAGTRNLEFARTRIEQNIKTRARAQAVADHLKANFAQFAAITVLDSATRLSVENVTIDSLTVSFESYFPGLGYANPEIYRALSSAKEGEWNGPYTSPQTAVLIKLHNKSVPSKEELESAIRDELAMAWQYGSLNAFNEFMRNLEANARVVNNLDLFYRE